MDFGSIIQSIKDKLWQIRRSFSQSRARAIDVPAVNVRRCVARGTAHATLYARRAMPSPHKAVPLREVTVRRARPTVRHAWQEKNWQVRKGLLNGGIPGKEYVGFYSTPNGKKFQGMITESEEAIEAFILNPPLDAIERYTDHIRCFWTTEKEDVYFVHMVPEPESVDGAILTIENFLMECEARAGRL